ncbi:MOSC domain-containing protein [Nostoc sp. 2RC]|uniref:MOSC domain-containing protein n=1 Tax=Nostoc sp. 2RC TaxID=2485484 RepID=UPI0021AB788F|nr:MOSC domain-containing protein [Nostoc sp. 2RC]
MKLISVCVGLPREVSWKRKSVTTGIFKQPVNGRVMLRTLNLDGDGQADLTVHGGVEKAVYAYPMEHYAYWRQELPDEDLPWGAFGENLTIEGLSETKVNIGVHEVCAVALSLSYWLGCCDGDAAPVPLLQAQSQVWTR